jgi:hypothetical protein
MKRSRATDANQQRRKLLEAADAIDQLRFELAATHEKLAAYERKDRAESLLRQMRLKGMGVEGATSDEEVLSKIMAFGDFDALEKAIAIQASPRSNHIRLDDADRVPDANGIMPADFGDRSHFEEYLLS